MDNETFLITGGAGFIGTNFVRMLANTKSNVNIIVVDLLTYAGNIRNIKDLIDSGRISFVHLDIADFEGIKKVFKKYSPDYVINFAAESHVDRSIKDSRNFIKTNVMGTQTLLEAARHRWKKDGKLTGNTMYIQISTDEVYGSLGKDGYFIEETPLDPHSPYSASKASADLLVQAYVDTHDFPAAITRCSNNYGPYQFPEKLIPLMINNILSGKKLPIYGDGMNIRDWIHVSDHCKAILEILEKSENGEVYNIGANNEWTNVDLIHLLLKTVRDEFERNSEFLDLANISPTEMDEKLIEFVKDRPGHDQRYAIDNSKIRKKIGWKPEIPFKEGLKETVKWYLRNTEWIEMVTSRDYKKYYKEMYDNRDLL